ncbi:MAG: adenosine-specific kinase [Candidatus Omnitrophica bacterium]|nr:adenosine-specific kinase [Candidatus Omnitrophota bacterium]MDD5574189.1 adenosine-specific kinase [Candidatus Omnitrophota bacterium]
MEQKTEVVKIRKPENVNVVLGQAHFIKTVEDLYEAIAGSVPGIKFGLAFSEASGACKVRVEGTDEAMKKLAVENALALGCGHSFFIFLDGAYPINILNAVKNCPEVCGIFAATANALEVVVMETAAGRGIMGVIDGERPKGAEDAADVRWRKEFLRKIGYKIG